VVEKLEERPVDAGVPETPPEFDRDAVRRRYLAQQARRRARVAHRRRTRWAGVRFWFVLLVLLVAAVALVITVLNEVQRLFGL
jgi:anti-sigma-K factor RskA